MTERCLLIECASLSKFPARVINNVTELLFIVIKSLGCVRRHILSARYRCSCLPFTYSRRVNYQVPSRTLFIISSNFAFYFCHLDLLILIGSSDLSHESGSDFFSWRNTDIFYCTWFWYLFWFSWSELEILGLIYYKVAYKWRYKCGVGHSELIMRNIFFYEVWLQEKWF